MKAGTLLLVIANVIAIMETRGIVLPTGEFDETKLDSLAEDAEFAAAVEGALMLRGVVIPKVVDKIIHALPLLALFVR